MGYGKRALQLLRKYYAGEFTSLNENDLDDDADSDNGFEKIDDEEIGLLKESIAPRKKIPTLLKRLSERRPERLDYIGTSYGLTNELLKFWKSQKFVPVYLSQKANDLTGEFSTIMISVLKNDKVESSEWLSLYFADFRRRFIKLLSKTFQNFTTGLALSVLDNKSVSLKSTLLTQPIIDSLFIPHDIQRLESYVRNQIEYRLILDLTADLGMLVFDGKFNDISMDALQKAILLGIGLQNKTIDKLSEEFNMQSNQILAKFFDCCKKLSKKLDSVMETTVEKTMIQETKLNRGESMQPTAQSFADELEEGAKELARKQKHELKRLRNENLASFAIKGTDDDWGKALASNKSSIISVKSGEKRLNDPIDLADLKQPATKKKKKVFNKKGKQF